MIIPRQGSWFFLAGIITGLDIPSDATPVPDRCGTCTRCIDACPTHALDGSGHLDPRKCISYLTIEHKGKIPNVFQGQWKDWVFGCDACQDVCPWNRIPEETKFTEFEPLPEFTETINFHLQNQGAAFDLKLIDGTALARTGWPGILRNFEFLERNNPLCQKNYPVIKGKT